MSLHLQPSDASARAIMSNSPSKSGAEAPTGGDDKVKKARDTLGSIYSFYATNRESLQRVPSFVSDSSRDIPILFETNTVPTAEQTEQFKKDLAELVETKEAIDQIPERERQMMMEAANASTIKRTENRAVKN